MDYLIIVGPKKLLVNFIAIATEQGYHTYTRLEQPGPNDPFVLVVNTTIKEISKFSKEWYFNYHHKKIGILEEHEKFPAYHISVNRMAAFVACDLTFDYYIIKKEYREIGEPYALRLLGKCKTLDEYMFSKGSSEIGSEIFSKIGMIEQLLAIKKTRFDWIVKNGNVWK